MKLAVVFFNLGGPDSLEAVGPFLQNLFSDPAIITLPAIFRWPLSRLIAARRAPVAREIYAQMGGRSPIREATEAQARALEARLGNEACDVRVFISMRCWKPFSQEAAAAVASWKPDRIVLLPLYPQFSTTTTASSLDDWQSAARNAGLAEPNGVIRCYPTDPGFVAAEASLIAETWAARRPGLSYRVLFSAHGLPKRVIARGDPYQKQVEQSVGAVVSALNIEALDWRISYQSRVGPLAWIEPATDSEVRRAGADGKALIVVPIAFVSEHSETLVELDIEYGRLAEQSGVPHYLRVPTVGTHPAFIEGLAKLVLGALDNPEKTSTPDREICRDGSRGVCMGGN